jgi:uncharacterized protein YbjT (DUF2867 family)
MLSHYRRSMKRILVIGATGNVGREVVAQLCAKGRAVRAVTRDPEHAKLPVAVEVVRADLSIPETLEKPLEDVDVVFLVWIAPPATIDAVLKKIFNNARRVVFLSSPHKTPHPLFQQPNPLRGMHAKIEDTIEKSGVEWTFLRPGMFAANARAWWAPQIRRGETVRWPYLGVPTAPIHERDIAAVGVRALVEDGHNGAEYILTGPESLTQHEQIAAIGRGIGRSLRIEEMSPEEALRELLAYMPGVAIPMLTHAWAAAAGHPAWMTSTVAEVTGAPARSLHEWVRDHAAEFQSESSIVEN